MKPRHRTALPCLLALTLTAAAHGQPAQQASPRQPLEALRASAQQFLQAETAGLPGQVTVSVGPLDARLQLAPCAEAPQAFLAAGSRAWGKTTVGLRCTAPASWTIYVQAQVSVQAEYIASAVPLAQGQTIEAGQLVTLRGDLTALPAGVATELAQVTGRSANVSLAAGTPLRLDTLRSKPVVQAGQLVRLVSSGAGFRVSAEARAMSAAAAGQLVQVRTASGQQISGIAQAGGQVDVTF